MSAYYELCRCGHIYYRHAWVPDPQNFDPKHPKTDCQACCCSAFEGTGQFDLSTSPQFSGGVAPTDEEK